MFDWVLNTPVDFLLRNYLIGSLIEIFIYIAKNKKKDLVIALIFLR